MPILGLKQPGPSHPPHFSLESLIRPNILALQPYRCARDDYSAGILLDANENAIGPALPKSAATSSKKSLSNGNASDSGSADADNTQAIAAEALAHIPEGFDLNRYPSPTHDELKRRIAKIRGVPDENWVFLGVGSDEVIDMLFRVMCVPGKDRVMTTPPTYGMYKVTANVNDVGVMEVPLIAEEGSFQLDEAAMDAAFISNPGLKLLFICSPGNPTGTLIPLEAIRRVLENTNFTGVVVVDEAYIDFAGTGASAADLVNEFANVCVSQTLSKSFGLAAIRYVVGEIRMTTKLTEVVSAPYNVSLPTAAIAASALTDEGLAAMDEAVATLNSNRSFLIDQLPSIPGIGKILGGNHANFVLVQVLDGPNGQVSNKRAVEVYKNMAESRGVVVRYRGGEIGCEGCLRITVGTREECEKVLEQLRELLA